MAAPQAKTNKAAAPEEKKEDMPAPAPKKKKKASQMGIMGVQLLKKEYKQLCKNPPDGISVGLVDDQISEWEVLMEGPKDTAYDGGWFRATLSFPNTFPNSPPKMIITTPSFWHPNVYKDGTVCISILHEPKVDEYNKAELLSEKWRPILSIEAVLISVLSMLSDPNFDSPANIDASVQWKKDPKGYRTRIRKLVRASQDALLEA